MKKYQPGNGTEGMMFTERFCEQCIHERWCHATDEDRDEDKCGIWSRTMIYDVDDPEYPEEWTYDEEGNPICTAWVKWDWGSKDDDGGLNEPSPPPPPDDPNQLCIPFMIDEIMESKEWKHPHSYSAIAAIQ